MTDPSATAWQKALPLTELPENQPAAAQVSGVDLVLLRTPSGVAAYDAICPHQGMLLSEGEVVGGQLVCQGHGWTFDVTTGKRCDEASSVCLKKHATRIEGGHVLVQLNRGPAAREGGERKLRRIKDLPGPRGLPLLGNALQIELPRVHQILEGWAKEYGSMYRVALGPRVTIVVTDLELMETLLRARPHSLRRVASIERVFAEMGVTGVFSAEGAAWRAQRKLALEALSNRHLRGFWPTLERVIGRLDRCWQASEGAPRVVQDDLMRFTVDVTTSLVFSTDMNTLEGGEDVLQRHLEHVFPAMTRRTLATIPYWRYFRLPADRALDRALAEVRKIQERLVAEARARLELRGPSAEAEDFLEAMLLARDESGQPFSDEVVHGNMLTMLLAGEDTTAQSLAWSIHLLCERPDVFARLRDEADRALGSHRTPPDFASVAELPYFDAVISEVLRLQPVAPLIALEAIDDMVVGDVDVPKGTWLDLMMRVPATSADHFTDPEQFRPERWLGSCPHGHAHVPQASLPFGSGPRICPGRSLALLEMRVVLATLVHNFDLEREGSADAVYEDFAFTVSPRGLKVRLRPRAV